MVGNNRNISLSKRTIPERLDRPACDECPSGGGTVLNRLQTGEFDRAWGELLATDFVERRPGHLTKSTMLLDAGMKFSRNNIRFVCF